MTLENSDTSFLTGVFLSALPNAGFLREELELSRARGPWRGCRGLHQRTRTGGGFWRPEGLAWHAGNRPLPAHASRKFPHASGTRSPRGTMSLRSSRGAGLSWHLRAPGSAAGTAPPCPAGTLYLLCPFPFLP